MAMAFIIFEPTRVFAGAVEPLEHSVPILFVFFPLALISDSNGPLVHTLSIDLIILELAPVDATVWEDQLTLSALHALQKFTTVA